MHPYRVFTSDLAPTSPEAPFEETAAPLLAFARKQGGTTEALEPQCRMSESRIVGNRAWQLLPVKVYLVRCCLGLGWPSPAQPGPLDTATPSPSSSTAQPLAVPWSRLRIVGSGSCFQLVPPSSV